MDHDESRRRSAVSVYFTTRMVETGQSPQSFVYRPGGDMIYNWLRRKAFFVVGE